MEVGARFRNGVAPAGNSRIILLIWRIMHVFATVVHLTLTNPIFLWKIYLIFVYYLKGSFYECGVFWVWSFFECGVWSWFISNLSLWNGIGWIKINLRRVNVQFHYCRFIVRESTAGSHPPRKREKFSSNLSAWNGIGKSLMNLRRVNARKPP